MVDQLSTTARNDLPRKAWARVYVAKNATLLSDHLSHPNARSLGDFLLNVSQLCIEFQEVFKCLNEQFQDIPARQELLLTR
jgi:hypothetical protein